MSRSAVGRIPAAHPGSGRGKSACPVPGIQALCEKDRRMSSGNAGKIDHGDGGATGGQRRIRRTKFIQEPSQTRQTRTNPGDRQLVFPHQPLDIGLATSQSDAHGTTCTHRGARRRAPHHATGKQPENQWPVTGVEMLGTQKETLSGWCTTARFPFGRAGESGWAEKELPNEIVSYCQEPRDHQQYRS